MADNDSCLLCDQGWEIGQRIQAIGEVKRNGMGGVRLVHIACIVANVAGDKIADEYIAREKGNG